MKKTIFSALVVLVVSFGLLIAQAGVKKRDFSGTANIQICKKDALGKWQIIDELAGTRLNFQFSVADVAGKKPLSTDFGFSGKSKNGLAISARLKNGATGSSDLTTGLVDMDLPLELTVNGKRADIVFKFTTESAQGALGNVSGRRAVIDQNARTAKLGMVSSSVVKDAQLVDSVMNHEEQYNKVPDLKQKRPPEIADQLLVVIVGDGTLRAL